MNLTPLNLLGLLLATLLVLGGCATSTATGEAERLAQAGQNEQDQPRNPLCEEDPSRHSAKKVTRFPVSL
jgi:hypothetical protein